MSIRLLMGRQERQGETKHQRIYHEIAKQIKKGRDHLFLVVPEQYTLGAERALMAETGLPGLMQVDVLSLERLADRIFTEAGGAVRAVVDEHGQQMLLAKSIIASRDALEVYKRSAGRPGFLQDMTAFINELKENDIDCGGLEAVAAQSGGQSLLSRKLQDIHTIFKNYEDALGQERLDGADRSVLLCEKIEKVSLLHDAMIWLDGFYTFSARDFEVIQALAARTTQLTMTLTGDQDAGVPDASVFEICRDTQDRMASIARETGQAFELIDCTQKASDATPLDFLEHELYSYNPSRWQGAVPAIHLRQCMDLWDEAEQAARQIISLVRDQGYRYQDIGILVGSPDSMGSTIARALALYDVPCFVDRLEAIEDHPLIEGFLAALNAVDTRYGKNALFGYAKSGFATVSPEAWMDLENASIAFGIVGLKWEKPFTQTALAEDYSLPDLNRDRAALIDPLAALRRAMAGEKTYRQRLVAAVDFLQAIDVSKTLDQMGELLEANGDFETLSQNNQIWNILMTVFDQIDSALGEEMCTLNEFINVLTGGVTTYHIGVLPERQDVVMITDAFRSRGSGARALFILGANEGLLPSETGRFAVLTDGERARLKARGLMLQDDEAYRRTREDYSIYCQIAQVTDDLFCSYAMNGEDGASLRVSSLVDQIRRVFPDVPVQSALNPSEAEALDWITATPGTLNALALKKSEKSQLSGTMEALVGAGLKDQGLCLPDMVFKHQDRLHQDVAVRLYGEPVSASVSRIERYRSCPFSHFVQYGLRPRPRREYVVDPPDIGTLLHSVIEHVFKTVKQQGTTLDALEPEQRDALVTEAMNTLLPQAHYKVFESTGAYQFLGRKLNRVSHQTVRMLSEHLSRGAFSFRYSEHQFEQRLQVPDLKNNVRIRGIVDRIDTYVKEGETFVKVVDYKTGNPDITMADVYYGLSLQLLVYLDESLALCGENETASIPAGTFYFHVDDPVVKEKIKDPELLQKKIDQAFQMNGLFLDDPRVMNALDEDNGRSSDIFKKGSRTNKLSRDEFEDILDYVKWIIADSVKGIEKGDIALKPYKMGSKCACDFCDYRAVCQWDSRIDQAAYRVLDAAVSKAQLLKRAREVTGHELDR